METKLNEREHQTIINPLRVKQDIKLCCKHCDEPLMQVVVMARDNAELLSWDVFAHCFKCESRSKTHRIQGQYAYCGILDGEKELTAITDVDTSGDTVAFTVIRKVNDAQEN